MALYWKTFRIPRHCRIIFGPAIEIQSFHSRNLKNVSWCSINHRNVIVFYHKRKIAASSTKRSHSCCLHYRRTINLNKYSPFISVPTTSDTGTGFSSVTVVVLVRDANDNPPSFVFPTLPDNTPDGNGVDTYFGVLSRDAVPFTPILKLQVQALLNIE